jgi:hypothetical protein
MQTGWFGAACFPAVQNTHKKKGIDRLFIRRATPFLYSSPSSAPGYCNTFLFALMRQRWVSRNGLLRLMMAMQLFSRG